MQKHLHKLTPTLTRVYYTLSMDSSDIKTFWTVILFLLSILYNVYLDSKLLLLEILLTKNYHNNEMKIYSNSYFAQYQSFVCSRVKTFQTRSVCLFPLLFTAFISQPFSFRLFSVCESTFLISLFVYYSLWVYDLI